jgi:hypothetical protein
VTGVRIGIEFGFGIEFGCGIEFGFGIVAEEM